MALASGKEVVEGGMSFPVYTGIFPIKVIAVNPTKKELEDIYGRPFKEDPVYHVVDPTTSTQRTLVSFVVRTIPEKCGGKDIIFSPIRIWVNDAFRYKTDKTKVQVCNPYGEFTWLTKEELDTNTKPTDTIFLMEDVRRAYIGEERLLSFLRAALNIPRVENPMTGEVIADKMTAVCRLDTMEKLVKTGDVTEIKKALVAMKMFKMGAGARTTDDNRTYQDWFIDYPMKGGVTDYKWYDNRVRDAKERGGYANTDFGVMPYDIQEYKVKPTEMTTAPTPVAAPAGPMDADEW